MALTSIDETDLILPLLSGMRENPPFSSFLERVRRRTEARCVALLVRRGEASQGEMTLFSAGDPLAYAQLQGKMTTLFALERADYDSLRPGRVYAIGEMVDHDPVLRAERRRQMSELGLADERIVRVLAEPRLNVWLVLARTSACRASDSALLSTLAPYVAEAMRSASELELERRNARISATGLARSGNGWMAFDRDARLIACAPETAAWWSQHKDHVPRAGERLLGLSRTGEKALSSAIQSFDHDPAQQGVPCLLSETPRIEALLVPLSPPPSTSDGAQDDHTAGLSGEFLALFTLPRDLSQQAAERLRAVHELPRREAELALKLAQGLTIAEAARAMGLTVETARNYSKRIYAKLGVRGKAELVRLVLEGTAGMA
ncbi:helix-turn-helix transcriptional regulator [Novosphingobium profundi]|uniref:helix-turn-helix transcriptional regulator n=1 Tax=Novosphingobium profundi TaxID=1774954 RepID=UPI001BDA0B5E|nr:helix-turn-helix transcriptional regulator [Novosphingobium profundi]MBT0669588.1 helix-turn-helix transcriptional regulator [Novosphingobium profundi]